LGFRDGQFARRVARCARFVTPNSLALVVTPHYARQHRASLRRNVRDAAERSEVVVVAALDREIPCPVAIQSFALIGADNQAALARRSSGGQSFECRPELFASRDAVPAFG